MILFFISDRGIIDLINEKLIQTTDHNSSNYSLSMLSIILIHELFKINE